MFDKNFDSQIPTWLLKWWEMFGLVPQILPPALQDTVQYFSSVFTVDNHASQFPAILHMMAKYKIHWISKWLMLSNLVVREYSVKWWDALKIDPTLSQVNKDFPSPVPRSIKTRSQTN